VLDIIRAILLVLLELFALECGSEDGEDKHEGEVEVEPCFDIGDGATLELLDVVEFVRVASSIKGDSTDEHVGSGKRSGEDNSLEEEAEGEASGNKGTGDVDDPEEPFLLGSKEGGSVDQESSDEATPSSDASSSEFLAFVEQESSSESEENRARKNYPSDPGFSFVTEEGGVENEEDQSSGDEGTNEEQGSAEHLSSEEAERDSDDHEKGSPQPGVLLHELPKGIERVDFTVGLLSLVCSVVTARNKLKRSVNDFSVFSTHEDNIECAGGGG
jgi:hypothetical protein